MDGCSGVKREALILLDPVDRAVLDLLVETPITLKMEAIRSRGS
jgi:hypothetical protein